MRLDVPACAARLRAAIEAAGILRRPGGNALARALALVEAGDPSAALAALPPRIGDAALPPRSGDPALAAPSALLEALLLDAGGRREAAEAALAAIVIGDGAPTTSSAWRAMYFSTG
jgi:hypothetical protein